jgi:hypothetical protein
MQSIASQNNWQQLQKLNILGTTASRLAPAEDGRVPHATHGMMLAGRVPADVYLWSRIDVAVEIEQR